MPALKEYLNPFLTSAQASFDFNQKIVYWQEYWSYWNIANSFLVSFE